MKKFPNISSTEVEAYIQRSEPTPTLEGPEFGREKLIASSNPTSMRMIKPGEVVEIINAKNSKLVGRRGVVARFVKPRVPKNEDHDPRAVVVVVTGPFGVGTAVVSLPFRRGDLAIVDPFPGRNIIMMPAHFLWGKASEREGPARHEETDLLSCPAFQDRFRLDVPAASLAKVLNTIMYLIADTDGLRVFCGAFLNKIPVPSHPFGGVKGEESEPSTLSMPFEDRVNADPVWAKTASAVTELMFSSGALAGTVLFPTETQTAQLGDTDSNTRPLQIPRMPNYFEEDGCWK